MVPLLSRTLDPLLGVFTGAFAYYLYENNPRTALPESQRLMPLVRGRVAKWRSKRERKLYGSERVEVDSGAIRVEKE